MVKKKTSMGYPGVFPNPGNQEKPEPVGELVRILAQDPVNTLIVDAQGSHQMVPNDQIRK